MAGKNTQRKFAKRIWDANSRLELLGYLDWCIEAKVDFKATAMDHLRTTAAVNVTFDQINGKLSREWNKWGAALSSFKDVYERGTVVLRPADGDIERIRKIVIRLGCPPIPRYVLRGTPSRLNTRSRTLSTVASKQGTPALTPKKASHLRHASHSHDNFNSSDPRANTTAPIQPLTTSATEKVSTGLAQGIFDGVVKGEGSELYLASSVEKSDQELSDSSRTSANKVNDIRPDTQSQISAMTAKLEHTQVKVLKQAACVFTLRNRLSEVRTELQVMNDRSQGMNVDQQRLQQEIGRLKGQLRARNRLLRDLTQSRTGTIGVPVGDVNKQYDALSQEIHDSCSFLGNMDPNDALPHQQDYVYQSAQTWAKMVSSRTLEQFIFYTKGEGIPMDKTVACLIGAAIFELVFQPVFPEVLALESPLLHQYRQTIFTSDGPQTLKQFDHIALKRLTSEEYFKSEVIPEKAESLAEFIVQSLRCFLPLEDEISGSSLSPSKSLLADLAISLERVLNLKVSFDLSTAQMKFIFFKPGDAFDGKTMKRDISQPVDASDNGKDKQHEVKICLLPALYALPAGDYDGEEMEGSVRQFSANYNNHFSEGQLDDLEFSTLISKAIILV